MLRDARFALLRRPSFCHRNQDLLQPPSCDQPIQRTIQQPATKVTAACFAASYRAWAATGRRAPTALHGNALWGTGGARYDLRLQRLSNDETGARLLMAAKISHRSVQLQRFVCSATDQHATALASSATSARHSHRPLNKQDRPPTPALTPRGKRCALSKGTMGPNVLP